MGRGGGVGMEGGEGDEGGVVKGEIVGGGVYRMRGFGDIWGLGVRGYGRILHWERRKVA